MQKDSNTNSLEERILVLEAEIKELATTIDTVEDEKLVVENQLKKALADYQNLERSIGGRIENRVVHMKKEMAGEVIAVLDDLVFAQQARDSLQLSNDEAAWADGMLGLGVKLEKALEGLGITRITTEIGGEFNANYHEAVAVIDPQKGDVPGTVKEIVQHGYLSGEIVIRPARVVVVKK